MRRTFAAIVVALVLLALIGFGVVRLLSNHTNVAATVRPQPSTCADAYRVLKLAPSQISAANAVCLAQSLQLTGEVAGSVAEAYTVDPNGAGPTQMCYVPKRWDGYPQAMLAFVAGGKAYRLRISTPGSSEHQALAISSVANVVELASISDPSQDWSRATGTLNVDPEGVSGTLDVNVVRDVNGAQPEHIAGHWACGAQLPIATADASVPCSSFYALNQLAAPDVARMTSKACIAEDLTLGGDVSAHLDHAVNDRGTSATVGYAGDNVCGSVGEQYEATLKFSVGDESFLLNLGASRYPAVTPGQYPATSGLALGVMLFLGHADATNHGAFVADERVFWIGGGGSFTIGSDMKSGTIDATVMGPTNSSSVQIKGSWRCAT